MQMICYIHASAAFTPRERHLGTYWIKSRVVSRVTVDRWSRGSKHSNRKTNSSHL